MSKRGQDTEWDASHSMEEIREFCFKEFAAVCLFWNFLFSSIPVILLVTQKGAMLIVTVSLKKASCGLPMEEPREAFSHIRYHLDRCHNSVFAVKLYISAGL